MESCGKAVSDRLLKDILGSVNDSTGGGWRVLILDEFATRLLSSAVTMADIQDAGNISVVENLKRKREPLPLAAVYFIQPTKASVELLVNDFQTKTQYPSVHVFFTSKAPKAAIDHIKSCPRLISVLNTLKESYVEFMTVDSRTMVTDQPEAPFLLMGDEADDRMRECQDTLDVMANRLVTLLATLKEFPSLRYKQIRPHSETEPPGGETRNELALRLTQRLFEKAEMMRQNGQLPEKETCDMIILDRSYDPVAPFVHEWTYECMVHEYLKVDGKVVTYEKPSDRGPVSDEASLDESDPMWMKFRHLFIADVLKGLADTTKEFVSKKKALTGADKVKALKDGDLRRVIAEEPALAKHHAIVEQVKNYTTQASKLTDLSELEQDIIMGEKNSKDMIDFLEANRQSFKVPDKLRLLLCYCATHPEKLDKSKVDSWMRAAGLTPDDMLCISSLNMLGLNVFKPDSQAKKGGLFSRGTSKAVPDLTRRPRPDTQELLLYRFEPLLRDVLVDLDSNRLPQDQFPYLNPPADGGSRGGLNWVRPRGGAGRKILVFIIGGVTRGEMRVVHEVSKSLNRDIILGSTSVHTPISFLNILQRMNSQGVMYGL